MELLRLHAHHHVLAARAASCHGGVELMRQQIANVVLIVSLLLPAGPAFSASGPDELELQSPVGERIESIVVTGRRPEVLRQLMLDFILEIGDPASRSRGYARWQDRLCVGVYNLPDQTAAQYISDKITITALEVGLKTGSPGCQPNLHIVFSPDARALAGRMVEESPRIFRPFGNAEVTTQGVAALEQFKTSEAPVRWWQITLVVDEVGRVATVLPGINDVGSNGSWTYPRARGEVSRIKSGVSDAIWGSLIIVDAGKLGNVKWPQLADYLTMVSSAQVAPNALPTGYASILNLFSADNPPHGMTDIDRIYLRALYEMDTMMVPHTQRGIFSHRMVRVLRELEDKE